MKATASLKHMGTLTVRLGDEIVVGDGPKGTRVVVDVLSAELVAEGIYATLAINDAADWLTLSDNGSLGAMDVRLTLKTDDGAFIYSEYAGRIEMEKGLLATAPTFQTGSEKYAWLNRVQAVGAGIVSDGSSLLIYQLYEVVIAVDSD